MTRLVSLAFKGSRQTLSKKGLQEQEPVKRARAHEGDGTKPKVSEGDGVREARPTERNSTYSVKESWFETSRRQKRRRQSGPVKYGRQKGFFYHSFGRFSNDEDEPIEIRIHQTGKSRKIYPDFQWFEDSKEDSSSRISYIRTTPGRALMNQLIYPSYEEEEPTGSLWAFPKPKTENQQ